jgi:hypothetical protein
MTFDAVGVLGLTFDVLLKICLSILWKRLAVGLIDKNMYQSKSK